MAMDKRWSSAAWPLGGIKAMIFGHGWSCKVQSAKRDDKMEAEPEQEKEGDNDARTKRRFPEVLD
ncbi:hypothetical protein PG995_009489 [Apiospora arundinis]